MPVSLTTVVLVAAGQNEIGHIDRKSRLVQVCAKFD
jgi:hypothetical protein